MSGGEFDYNQYNIKDIAERLEFLLERQGKEVAEEVVLMPELLRG